MHRATHGSPCTMLRTMPCTTHCVHGKDDARHYIFSRYMQPTDMRLLRFVRQNSCARQRECSIRPDLNFSERRRVLCHLITYCRS